MRVKEGNHVASRETLEEALHWLEVLRSEDVSEAKVLGWLAWYEASEKNSRAFDELQEMHGLTHDLLTGPQAEDLGRKLQCYRWWHQWLWRAESWFASRASWSNISPLVLRRGALACGVALVAIIAGFVMKPIFTTSSAYSTASIVAPQQRLVSAMTLPDDSRIELAPRTPVSVAYSATERRLEMGSGQALFVVAHQKERPFIVHVDALRVRAVGTQFNIHRTGDRVEVTVIEGKIDVYREDDVGNSHAAAGSVYRIVAGNSFSVAGPADKGSVAAVDAQDSLTWRDGKLHYVHVPLESVIADVNRYIAKPIVIEDAKIKEIPYTGSVFVESIDEWLGAIAKEFQLVVIDDGDSTKLRSKIQEPSTAQ